MADADSLGGVSAEEVAALTEAIGVPADAGASLLTRFSRRVADLIATRQAKGENGQYAVFLQSDEVSAHAQRCKHVEAPLLANGADPISDAVWLATSNLMLSFRLCLAWSDQASLFDAIRGVGLGHIPAIVVDFRGQVPIGRLYRSGLDSADVADDIALDDSPITPAQMKMALDRFYEASLRTPLLIAEGHAMRVWKDAGRGIPEHRPEERIQGRLLDSLRGVFSRHDLRAEPVTDDGRADIVISRKTTTKGNLPAVIHEWVLELKALADMTSTGNPSTTDIPAAVRSGLEQALAYKQRLNALCAALCCYDMRVDDCGDAACFAHIASDAVASGLPLWRWYMFRSTAAGRRANNHVTAGSV